MPYINHRLHLLLAILCLILTACTPSGDRLARTDVAPSRAQAAAISQDGSYALIATHQHGLHLWDLNSNTLVHNWQQEEDGISQLRSVALAADNSVAVAASRETVALWDISSGAVLGYWRIDESTIRDIAVSNQGRHLAIGRSDGVIVIFEPSSGRRLEFFGHSERINSLDISPNGRYVISGGDDHQSLLWNTDSAQVLHRFPASSRVTLVRFDPSGEYAFSASSQSAQIIQLTRADIISELRHNHRYRTFISAAFSADNRYLITGSPSRRIELWRTADGERQASTLSAGREGDSPPVGAIISAAFNPDNQVFTISSAGFLEQWHFALD